MELPTSTTTTTARSGLPPAPAEAIRKLLAEDMSVVRSGRSWAPLQRSYSKPEYPTTDMGAAAMEAECEELRRNTTPPKKFIFLRNFSVLEEDVVICNRVRAGIDPIWFHKNYESPCCHRLRTPSFELAREEARLADTRGDQASSSASQKTPKTRPNLRIIVDNSRPNAGDAAAPDSVQGRESNASTASEDVEAVMPLACDAHPRRTSVSPDKHTRVISPQRRASERSILLTPREKAMHSRYLIHESFSSGSYGNVCAGQDKASLREIAVKIVPKHILISPEERESVIREQEIHKRLDHPNIIKLLDVFENADAHYFMLERAGNGSLHSLVTFAGMEETTCRELFHQLLLALEYLHRNNIVHHDIKPENVLLDHDCTRIKLCDFGASRAFAADQTSLPFTSIFGTPGYIAPELLDGKKGLSTYGPAIDMFSAGVMLFEMVFGFGPFYPPSACTHQELEFPPKTTVSRLMQQFLSRLLERDPQKRITASEALKHPWITRSSGRRSTLSSPVSSPSGASPLARSCW